MLIDFHLPHGICRRSGHPGVGTIALEGGASLRAPGRERRNRVVKRAVRSIGLDPALHGAHSLPSGFCTSAAEGGADLSLIMRQSRHRSVAVATRYVQAGQLFQNPASKAIGL